MDPSSTVRARRRDRSSRGGGTDSRRPTAPHRRRSGAMASSPMGERGRVLHVRPPTLATSLHWSASAAITRRRTTLGMRPCFASIAEATYIAHGNESFDGRDMLTSSVDRPLAPERYTRDLGTAVRDNFHSLWTCSTCRHAALRGSRRRPGRSAVGTWPARHIGVRRCPLGLSMAQAAILSSGMSARARPASARSSPCRPGRPPPCEPRTRLTRSADRSP